MPQIASLDLVAMPTNIISGWQHGHTRPGETLLRTSEVCWACHDAMHGTCHD